MNDKRLQEIKDSIDFQREILIAHNMNTLCVDEEQELYDYIINLQSKIDKANELLEERKERVEDISWVEMKIEDYIEEINEIENILKEDK